MGSIPHGDALENTSVTQFLAEGCAFEIFYNEMLSKLSTIDATDLSMMERGQKFGFDVVFTHNDILAYNIMIPTGFFDGDDDDTSLIFIDYEYAGYNSRAFDIANHFCGKLNSYFYFLLHTLS